MTAAEGVLPREVAEPLVLMLAPLTPHVAEELWARLGHPSTLTYERFPEADPALLVDDEIELPVQLSEEEVAIAQRITWNTARIYAEHKPRMFEGDLVVVVATANMPEGLSIVEKWAPHTGGEIAEFSIPCRHRELLRPEILAQVGDIALTWMNSEADLGPDLRGHP